MKYYYPLYYNDFSCIAGKCPDSCCRKWEIVIDNETINKYREIRSSFSEKILSSVIKDEDGDVCFKLKDGNCPFLNSQGLCDIHINLGEEYTSEICRNHPRFIEEYDSFTEVALSLSCPEANRIILSSDINKDYYLNPEYSGADEVLSLLIESRQKLLKANKKFNSLIRYLLDTAADDSLDIDLVYIESHPEFTIDFMKDTMKLISEKSEILTAEWKNILYEVSNIEVSRESLDSFIEKNRESLIKVFRYFVYRYYLKAVNDLDVYSRALFIASSCYLIALVSLSCGISVAESARLFSKETEHNLYNIDLLLSYFAKF